MAGPKRKSAAKGTTAKRSTPKRARSAIEKRTSRDVQLGPSSQRIEESFDQGTKVTLSTFREKVGWD